MIVDAGGGLPWGQMTYEDYVGFEMNAKRMAMRRVYYDALAKSLADGTGEVPMSVVMSVCNSRDEAKRLVFSIEAERDRALKGF